jgi:hypothetical protein
LVSFCFAIQAKIGALTGLAQVADSSLRKFRLFMIPRLGMISNRFGLWRGLHGFAAYPACTAAEIDRATEIAVRIDGQAVFREQSIGAVSGAAQRELMDNTLLGASAKLRSYSERDAGNFGCRAADWQLPRALFNRPCADLGA